MKKLDKPFKPIKCPVCNKTAFFWNTRMDNFFSIHVYADSEPHKAVISVICPNHNGPIGVGLGLNTKFTFNKSA